MIWPSLHIFFEWNCWMVLGSEYWWFTNRRRIAVLVSPFLIGQVNSGETETIGLWGIIATLTLLVEQRWRWAGFMAILTAIGSWYYGSYIAIILGLWTLIHDVRIRQLKATVGLGIFIWASPYQPCCMRTCSATQSKCSAAPPCGPT